jgi:alkylated DNA repair dioxygenase AlkB
MGLHSDAEPELGPDPVVATVSLGAVRRFILRPRSPRQTFALSPVPRGEGEGEGPPPENRSYDLEHGSLLIMGGRCQAVYRHGIPRQPAVTSERLSLTFRWLKNSPAA